MQKRKEKAKLMRRSKKGIAPDLMLTIKSWNGIFPQHIIIHLQLFKMMWLAEKALILMQSHAIILTALHVILIHKGASSTHVMTDILIALWHSSTSSSSRAWTFPLTHTFADKLKLAYDMTLIVLRTACWADWPVWKWCPYQGGSIRQRNMS